MPRPSPQKATKKILALMLLGDPRVHVHLDLRRVGVVAPLVLFIAAALGCSSGGDSSGATGHEAGAGSPGQAGSGRSSAGADATDASLGAGATGGDARNEAPKVRVHPGEKDIPELLHLPLVKPLKLAKGAQFVFVQAPKTVTACCLPEQVRRGRLRHAGLSPS